MPTTYSFSPDDKISLYLQYIGISFDSSKIVALYVEDDRKRIATGNLCVWDLPSGALIHNIEYDGVRAIQWSWRDQYLLKLLKPWHGNHRYLNAETFQEEVLEHPGDRFQDPNPLCHRGMELRIRLSSESEYPLFLALPSHLRVEHFASRGDWACISSWDGRLLLLDTSGLAAYMEIWNLQPEVSRMEVC